MNVFLCQDFSGSKAFLNEGESLHASKVLRKKIGDEISLIDGKGGFYKARIISLSNKKCEIEVLERRFEDKHPYYLHLAVAPTKNISRFEWMIEKAIEIGVDEITPLLCHHSERSRINIDRINKIALSAVKQSLSPYTPVINDMLPVSELIALDRTEKKIVAHLNESSKHLKNIIIPWGSYCLMVGPEGDFSNKELELFRENEIDFCILGNKRLRTETAAVVIAQIINGIHF